MAKKLALIGGGGHALSLLDILPSPYVAAGYVDINTSPDMPIPYMGNDDSSLSSYPPSDYEIIVTMVSGPACRLDTRAILIERYEAYTSPVVTSPTATVSENTNIGNGTAIFHRCVINTGASIGRHSIINTGAIIEHECNIGNNVFIGPGAIICGGAAIDDNTYIGAGTIVKPGMHICSGATIGAGAVVTHHINTPGTYVGIPAKKI